MNVLHTYLLQSKAAQGCTVLVSGEAGIGKTRVVNELINIADLEGFSVLLGNCMYESQTPYMPFLEALKSRELGELLIKDSPRVEAVYLVTPTGLLIKEVVRLETSLDSDIFTSVLTTVSNFVTDSLSTLLKADTEGTLNTLGYEDYRIIIESRKSVNVVAIISGKENEFLIKDLRDIAQKVIENYGSTLQQWDGDEETVMGIENIINPLITSGKYDGMDYSDSGMLARRNRLFENVAKDLKTQTEQKPVLLILEDLQWVDPSSMTLFQYISKSMKTNKILIVGTFRTEEITTTDGTVHPLTKTLELMTSEGLYNKLELHRLPKNLMPEFFSSVLGKVDFSETFIDKFYIETGGNPLFMSELLKFLEEEKIITEHEGIWIEEKNIQNIEIPSKIYNVISRRLNRLDSENRKILDYASVMGVIFNSITLAEALSINESELLEKLKVVEETYKLIQSIDNRYRFDHAMIKEALYNEIPEELRIEYHSLIGQAIEKLNENNLNEVIGDLAFHYYKCRNNEKALKYLLSAAESAKRTFAYDEAVQFYLQAMEIENNVENRKSIHENLQHILNLKETNGKGLNT
jgi:predicted ATPase